MESIVITGMHRYLGKSMVGEPVKQLTFDDFGPRGDRRVMAVYASGRRQGRMLTQRTCPKLALITAKLTANGLKLSAPGLEPRSVSPPTNKSERVAVRVHNDHCYGLDLGPDVAGWLGSALGVKCRLVWMPSDHARPVDPRFTETTPQLVGYADGFQLMAMNPASVAEFNDRLRARGIAPASMSHFRPNLELALPPYAEDELVGCSYSVVGRTGSYRGVGLRFAKLNARCVTVNVRSHGQTVTVDPNILKVLGEYRTMTEPVTEERGIMLGVNL
jgi:uncharacterized protein YcbX